VSITKIQKPVNIAVMIVANGAAAL